jgi:hypothetical protein
VIPPKTVTALAVLQGLLITNNITVISLGSLTGTCWRRKIVCYAAGDGVHRGRGVLDFLLSQLMRRYGRRAGFTLGASPA